MVRTEDAIWVGPWIVELKSPEPKSMRAYRSGEVELAP